MFLYSDIQKISCGYAMAILFNFHQRAGKLSKRIESVFQRFIMISGEFGKFWLYLFHMNTVDPNE